MMNKEIVEMDYRNLNKRIERKRPKCETCGKPIFNRMASSKYCKPCAKIKFDAYRKIYRLTYYLKIKGKYKCITCGRRIKVKSKFCEKCTERRNRTKVE